MSATTYSDSNGNRYTTSQINNRVKKAKREKLESMEFPHCETCQKSSGVRLDMSHLISVKWAKENGKCEIAWDILDILMECNECHPKTETQSHLIRMSRYLRNKTEQ